ncbi:MAG: autotransporter strand-loop-strand O-heptosyltransferase [Proteobacteria bacterium]|nr:autotransporter strand-loop-strand O-heptosyltransferase [Pseudomonadota bacterium]
MAQTDAPPPTPVIEAAAGIRFDFNEGARVALPSRASGVWRVRLSDIGTGNTLYESTAAGGMVMSAKKWFFRGRIEVFDGDKPVLDHSYDARGQDVLIRFHVGTLGDILAWFPYAAEFARLHGCRLTCSMSELLIPLFRDVYPAIRFVTPDAASDRPYYATYKVMMFFGDRDRLWNTCEGRTLSLQQNAAYLLGVDPEERRPMLALPDEARPIPEPYVCIATQATGQAKYWNNPDGWDQVVAFLQGLGLRVICIDQKPVTSVGFIRNSMPRAAEDQTGDRPLVERALWLRHATLFVGLSSGLSWLAWAAGAPVVMISGFTHPTNEFSTPYRVINWHACNSCWNDDTAPFESGDFLWCPRHKDTPRMFECSRLITAHHVIGAIRRVPAVAALTAARATAA